MNPVLLVALIYAAGLILWVLGACWLKTTERKFFVDRPSGHPPTGRHLHAVKAPKFSQQQLEVLHRLVATTPIVRSLPSPQGLSDDPATGDAWLVAEGLLTVVDKVRKSRPIRLPTAEGVMPPQESRDAVAAALKAARDKR